MQVVLYEGLMKDLECDTNCIIKRTELMSSCRPDGSVLPEHTFVRRVTFALSLSYTESFLQVGLILHVLKFCTKRHFCMAKEPAYISRVRLCGKSDN